MNPYLSAMIGVVAGALCAGVTVDLKRELDHANYVLSEKAQQDEIRKGWEAKLAKADEELARFRSLDTANRATNDRLRSQIDSLKRNAKDAKSKYCVECEELGLQCRRLLEEARSALGYCARILN